MAMAVSVYSGCTELCCSSDTRLCFLLLWPLTAALEAFPRADNKRLRTKSYTADVQVPGTNGVLGQGAEEQKGETARLVSLF